MDNNRLLLLLILSLGLNTPVLSHWGIHLNRLLCLLVPEGESKNVISHFTDKRAFVINEGASPARVKNRLAAESFTFIIYTMNPERKNGAEILHILYGAVSTGFYDDRTFSSTVIVVSDNQYLSDPEKRLFVINLDRPLYTDVIPLEEVVPKAEDLSLVAYKIKGLETTDPGRFAMYAAACFPYPYHKDDELLGKYIHLAASLCAADEAYHGESECLDMLFIKCLRDWCEKNHFSDIIDLPYLSEEEYERLSTAMFYNAEKELIFMSEHLFGQITTSMTLSISSLAIKRALIEANIIVPEPANLKTFTVKMSCFTGPEPHRPRMLRFNSNKLTTSSGLKLIDICKMRKHMEGSMHEE